ncbi:substrate-binding domain-containing protein [Amycolatopsis sp. NPDC059657]|uniref:substrate-binding domain-containing protein n=1 Tax=Amycolatopsis sp. NPDC059657 TaxID=3346899 RepID=UPI00366B7613
MAGFEPNDDPKVPGSGRGRPKTDEHYTAIAEQAHTTTNMVKNFFSRPSKLGAKTRRQIADVVADYGWRPATHRRGTLAGKTIGYEVPRSWTSPNPIFIATFYACTLAIQRQGGRVAPFVVDPAIPGYEHENHEDWLFRFGRTIAPRAYQEVFSRQRVNAFVVDDPRVGDERLSWMDEDRIPYVVLGTPEHAERRFNTDINDAQGFKAMVGRLCAAGCSRHKVAHYGFAEDGTMVPGRRRSAVAQALGIRPEGVPRLDRPYQATDDLAEIERIAAWLRKRQPDAVVCDSDAFAMLVSAAAPRAGRRISLRLSDPRDPTELLLAGCDDLPARRTAESRWMTLRQPAGAWAEKVVELLANAIHGDPPRRILVEPEIVDPPLESAKLSDHSIVAPEKY